MAAESERTQPIPVASASGPSGTVWKNRYLLEKELGRGGFGVVFLARDQQLLSKPVVIKLLQDGTSPDPYFQKKFQQEIEAMARIDHPGVVGVLDTGESPDQQPFLVMQFVEGATLRTLISKGGMEFRQAARILRQVGQALSAAHDKGVFHRDLKPENIMVQPLGEDEIQVKLIDFGIASVRDSAIISGQTMAQGQPQASKVVGTLAYMAPEQVMGQAGGASDIYALGVIAYEMLTGQRPEITPQGLATMPRRLRSDIPEAAESAIVKAVSYQPDQRQSRPRDFGEEIARALGAEASISAPVPAVPPTAPSSSSQGLEMAYVLFMDLVSYSMLPMDVQSQRIQHLAQIVRATAEYQRAHQANQIISLPTGDGMALVFFQNPVAPVQCAIEVARELKNHPDLKLRMGVHTGPVYRIADINTNINVAGGGINSAQRVMDVGDSGHILVSKTVSDILNQLSDWSKTMQDLGEAEVKHGVKMHVVNLVTAEVGNPEVPEKLKKARAIVEQMPSAPALPVPSPVAKSAAVPMPIASQPPAPAAYQQNWNQPARSGGAGKFVAIAAAVVVAAGLAAWQMGMFGGRLSGEESARPSAVPADQSAIIAPASQQPQAGGGGNSGGGTGGAGIAGGAMAGAAASAVPASGSSAVKPAPASATSGPPASAASTAPIAAAQSATPTPAAASTPAPAQASAPPPQAASAALGGLRSEFAMLAGRAGSVGNSLNRLEQQQSRMGVGLRGDMAAARDSMEYLMGEAKSALAAGDADTAKRNMDLAERQVEKLEDFLGR